jgi:DNA-binding NarL/FixJ family response regulator
MARPTPVAAETPTQRHRGDGSRPVGRSSGPAKSNTNSGMKRAEARRLIERHLQLVQPSTELVARLGRMTEREREVLTLVARGLSNAEIATALHLGEATVRTHIGHVFAKAGARDRSRAVVFAYESGLVRTGDIAGA